jgi:hypothetical protein
LISSAPEEELSYFVRLFVYAAVTCSVIVKPSPLSSFLEKHHYVAALSVTYLYVWHDLGEIRFGSKKGELSPITGRGGL